jgi:AraC-like DNA-binding protein
LSRYSRALTGATITIPPAIRVRQPRPGALKDLIALHTAATRVTEMRPGEGYGAQAAHGLEQELIDRLVECLTVKPVNADYASACRAADVLARFEDSIEENPHQFPRMAQLCRDLDIAERTLRRCCFGHLGMGPVRYLRLRRMQLVHRALRSAAVKRTTVTQAVRQQGFHEIGRFAGLYRAHYGELPSATLRRSMAE